MDFIIDNWPWLLAIVVFFVMAIIGYYSEKTGYTKKIKFKKEKELPTFDIDVDPLKDVEEVDTKVVTENQAEEEFKTSKSAEKVAEKLIESVDRKPDIRDIEEEPNNEYEYVDVGDDDNVNVLYEVVDENGNFDPNNVSLANNNGLTEEEAIKVKSLLQNYDDIIKPNIEGKKLFGEETGYLDKTAAEKLLKIIKQYEKDIKPTMNSTSTTDLILSDLLEAGSKVTSASTINQDISSKIFDLLAQYEDMIKPSINDAKDMQKLLENVEDYRSYISSKTVASTDENVFNMLESYANSLNQSLNNSNDKLLNIARQYEKDIKPNISDSKAANDVLNNIMTLSADVNNAPTDENIDNLNSLLDNYKTIIEPELADKKEYKKLTELVDSYKDLISSKRSVPVSSTIITEEEKADILDLAEQYKKYIKPYILNKNLFGKEEGHIDKKYANNILSLIEEYDKAIKEKLPDSKNATEILNNIIDFSSKTDFRNITQEEVDTCEDLINRFGTIINDNVKDEKVLSRTNELISEILEYLDSITIENNIIDSSDVEVPSVDEAIEDRAEEPIIYTPNLEIPDSTNIEINNVENALESMHNEEALPAEDVLAPVVIPSKKKETIMPIVIPSKHKFKKSMVLKATKQNKKVAKRSIKTTDVDEILSIIKDTDTSIVKTKAVTKPVKEDKVEDTNKLFTTLESEVPVVIKSKSKEKIKPVKITRKKAKKKTEEVEEFIGIVDPEEEPVRISSKTNRYKKKKRNKIKKEIKKLEKIEKEFDQELKGKKANIELADIKDATDSFDMEYDMIEADEGNYED